jgi:hypothetical protein
MHYKHNRLMMFNEQVSFYSCICTSAINTRCGQRGGVLEQVVHTKNYALKDRQERPVHLDTARSVKSAGALAEGEKCGRPGRQSSKGSKIGTTNE